MGRAKPNQAIVEQYKKIAADLVLAHKGEITVKEALTRNGVAEAQAAKGWTLVRSRKALNTAFETALKEDYGNLPTIDLAPEQDVKLINSRLRQNIIEGKDTAVQSAKLLGSRKDLSMWQADSVAGVVIIESPKSIPALPDHIEGFQVEK